MLIGDQKNLKMSNKKHLINREIKYKIVKLVGFFEDPKDLNINDAIKLANESNMDLVLINNKQDNPIVKIIDYNKFLYDIDRKERINKKNSKNNIMKEIKLSVNIGDNDIMVKIKKTIEFLQKGNKVKTTLQLRGRQRANTDRGKLTILKFIDMLSEYGSPESLPTYQSNKWSVIIKPTKKHF